MADRAGACWRRRVPPTTQPPPHHHHQLPPYGWVMFRFVAAYPGVWLLHCHALLHLYMGQALLFVVSPDTIPSPPPHPAPLQGRLLRRHGALGPGLRRQEVAQHTL